MYYTKALAVYLESLSYWKVTLHRCFWSFAACNRFSFRTALYLPQSIFPLSLTSFPVHAKNKQPHRMMQPPICSKGYCIQSDVFSHHCSIKIRFAESNTNSQRFNTCSHLI
ncbi:hypothetical protein AMECASPLE_015050 [Ameca splendens]|uniref:Uncharacterized protein n=1 Tax=Ameca splendens TaxID=208324 RepID=A0ABV1A8J7_9TELE